MGGDPEVARGRGRTLVFAASTAAADAAAAALSDAGLEPLLYHRLVPADDRAAALDAMRSGCGESPRLVLFGACLLCKEGLRVLCAKRTPAVAGGPSPCARHHFRCRAGCHAQQVPIWGLLGFLFAAVWLSSDHKVSGSLRAWALCRSLGGKPAAIALRWVPCAQRVPACQQAGRGGVCTSELPCILTRAPSAAVSSRRHGALLRAAASLGAELSLLITSCPSQPAWMASIHHLA